MINTASPLSLNNEDSNSQSSLSMPLPAIPIPGAVPMMPMPNMGQIPMPSMGKFKI